MTLELHGVTMHFNHAMQSKVFTSLFSPSFSYGANGIFFFCSSWDKLIGCWYYVQVLCTVGGVYWPRHEKVNKKTKEDNRNKRRQKKKTNKLMTAAASFKCCSNHTRFNKKSPKINEFSQFHLSNKYVKFRTQMTKVFPSCFFFSSLIKASILLQVL